MSESAQRPSAETRAVHAGEEPRVDGSVVQPIFQSAMYEYRGPEDGEPRYIRYGNTPNQSTVEKKLADLEGGEEALVTASGMAAITTSLLSVLSPGDQLLAQPSLYGGTHDLFTSALPELGIDVTFLEGDDPRHWETQMVGTARAVYAESISNPLMEVVDLEDVVEFAHGHDLVAMIDNTFATPVNFRPLEVGFDLSIHSATKYLNGHSDVVAGGVVGPAYLVRRARKKLKQFGGSLDPHACFLLNRGIKTLGLRMERHNESALRLARFLEGHRAVSEVNYPGLESHPAHGRASRLFDGYGGMISFELEGGRAAAEQLMDRLTIPVVAPSLGGVESLVTRPAATSHAGMDPAERERLGITEGLVRVSVGVESADDLVADFENALEAASSRSGAV
ncbi:MAG: PLP-dependent aspartate aminotransferase family protein [Gemmatimonadota bacterium]